MVLHLTAVRDLDGHFLISQFAMKGNSTDDIGHALFIWSSPRNGSLYWFHICYSTTIKSFLGGGFNIVAILIVKVNNIPYKLVQLCFLSFEFTLLTWSNTNFSWTCIWNDPV